MARSRAAGGGGRLRGEPPPGVTCETVAAGMRLRVASETPYLMNDLAPLERYLQPVTGQES